MREIAGCETDLVFDIVRQQDFDGNDMLCDAGAYFCEARHHEVAQRIAALPRPGAVMQFLGHVVDECGKNVPALRRKGGVEQRGDEHVDQGISGRHMFAPVRKGAFHRRNGSRETKTAANRGTSLRQTRKDGCGVERQVDLCGDTFHSYAANALHQTFRQILPLEEAEETPLHIEAGQNGPRFNLLAIGEHDALDLAIPDTNVGDFGFHAQHATGGADCGDKRLNKCRRTTGRHKRFRRAARRVACFGKPGKDETRGACRRAGAKRAADHCGRRQMRLDEIVFEISIQEIGSGERPEAQYIPHIVRRHGGYKVRMGELRPQAAEKPPRPRMGGTSQQRRQPPDSPQHVAAIARESIRIDAREARNLAAIDDTVAVARMIAAIRKAGDATFGPNEAEPVIRQTEIGNDARRQAAASQCEARKTVARRNLVFGREATRCGAAIKHKHVEPRLRQIGGGNEPVEPGSDHDCIVTLHAPPTPQHLPGMGRSRRKPFGLPTRNVPF